MKNNEIITISKGLIYDMYGIFIDYLIDTNQFKLLFSPENNFENFCNLKTWGVTKILIEGKTFLIADFNFSSFSYCNYSRCDKKILKSGMNSLEAIEELKTFSHMLGIEVLDILEFYLHGNRLAVHDNKYYEIYNEQD